MVTRIPNSDMKYDANDLKVKWHDNKIKYILLINNVSIEYVKERVPIAYQKYFCLDHME